MPTFYSRQSAAEIVDGQVMDASDFNDEYDAIVTGFADVSSYVDTFFLGTTSDLGHNHTGSDGEGPLIHLTGTVGITGVTGVLASKYGGVTTSTSDPTASFSDSDYQVGALWVNTSARRIFISTDNTLNAAIWQELQGVTGTFPTVNDDIDQGYNYGSVWLNTGTTPTTPYVCADPTNGAAVWVPLGRGRKHYAASDPAVTDDVDLGFEIGSVWVNTSDAGIFIATDVTDGAAVWKEVPVAKAWEIVTATGTFSFVGSISNGDKQLIDTTLGSFSTIAPSAGTADVEFSLADYAHTWDTAPVHVTGSFIGVTGTLVLDVKGASVSFVSKNSLFRIV